MIQNFSIPKLLPANKTQSLVLLSLLISGLLYFLFWKMKSPSVKLFLGKTTYTNGTCLLRKETFTILVWQKIEERIRQHTCFGKKNNISILGHQLKKHGKEAKNFCKVLYKIGSSDLESVCTLSCLLEKTLISMVWDAGSKENINIHVGGSVGVIPNPIIVSDVSRQDLGWA